MTNPKSKCCNADLMTIIYGDMACYACKQCKKRYDVEGMKPIKAGTPYDSMLNQATEEVSQMIYPNPEEQAKCECPKDSMYHYKNCPEMKERQFKFPDDMKFLNQNP